MSNLFSSLLLVFVLLGSSTMNNVGTSNQYATTTQKFMIKQYKNNLLLAGKKIHENRCLGDSTYAVSYGNSCATGNENCIPHSCPG